MGSPKAVWQQDLLQYGNTSTMIDATYKTTKYDLRLFFFFLHVSRPSMATA